MRAQERWSASSKIEGRKAECRRLVGGYDYAGGRCGPGVYFGMRSGEESSSLTNSRSCILLDKIVVVLRRSIEMQFSYLISRVRNVCSFGEWTWRAHPTVPGEVSSRRHDGQNHASPPTEISASLSWWMSFGAELQLFELRNLRWVLVL